MESDSALHNTPWSQTLSGLKICSSLIRSGQKSKCELFAQVAQDTWAIVSKLLRSLTKNERMRKSLTFWVNRSFATSNSLQNSMSEFPTMDSVLHNTLLSKTFFVSGYIWQTGPTYYFFLFLLKNFFVTPLWLIQCWVCLCWLTLGRILYLVHWLTHCRVSLHTN